jgi:hypothetical protein
VGGDAKIDNELLRALERLGEQEETDVLVYPKRMGEDLKEFLAARKKEGLLDYNILHLANCIAIKARKNVLLQIASRDDVLRMTINPRFTAHQGA